MTSASAPLRHGPLAESAESTLDPDEIRAYVAPRARAILSHAFLVGVAADLLLRDGFAGVGFPIWVGILALCAVSLVWRDGRRVPHETAAWLGLAVLYGAAMAWRGSSSLQALDFLATLFALGMAAVSLADPRTALLAQRMRDTVWTGIRVVASIAVGALPLALRDVALPGAGQALTGSGRAALRAALIALPLLLVFGALLRGADPLFASFVALPEIDFDTIVSHVVIVGFFAWVTAGWARGALLSRPSTIHPIEQLPFSLGMHDVTAALGTLILLFALYVMAQLGWFFGGERFLQAQTGLTAAQYARQGFFQMVWVVLLVVPLLLVTRAALRPERELARRHSALALPLLALLGVMILSAVLRLRLYVDYYGLTLDRLYPLVFMGWLAIVLACLALTVLRGRGRTFAAGAVVSGLAILVGLNMAVPDLVVARVNLARGQAAVPGVEPLDLAYLASLDAEAVPLAVSAVLGAAPAAGQSNDAVRHESERCLAATRLIDRWSPNGSRRARRREGDRGWRSWNRGDAAAEKTVETNGPALLAVRHDACPRKRITPAGSTSSAAVPPTAPAGR